MDQSPNLNLPYILAAQAQKHVTHNEALRALDAIIQLTVLDRDLTAPPASPANGDRYIVASGATAAWTGQDDNIAAFQDGAWAFYAPLEGWTAWIADEDELSVWDGAAWVSASGSTNPVALVGVNATADTTNRLAVSSPASLFSHEGGGHQLKINKNAASDTGTVLYQTGFSGRAEMGLAGDDDYHFKVSANGSAWTEALVIDNDDGAVRFPAAKIGVGAGAPGAAVDIDATSKALTGLRVKTDVNENTFQFLRPDGSNLLQGLWDGGNFHHFLGGTLLYNLGNEHVIFSTSGSGRVYVAALALDGAASLLTSQGLRIGEGSYATASVQNTTPQIAMKSWAWNGSNGFSLGTDVELRLSQLSATNDDARFGLRRPGDATELFSLLVGNGNVGIGQTSPTAKLHVNGAVRVASYTVASLPSASGLGAGSMIYVSDETGGAVLAFSDGTDWRRVTDRAVVS